MLGTGTAFLQCHVSKVDGQKMKLQKSDLRMRPVNKTRHCADDVNNVRTTFTDQSDHIKTVAMSRTGDTNTINSEMHLTILPARCYGCMTRCVVSASSLGYLTTRTPDLHASYRDLKDVLSTCKHTLWLHDQSRQIIDIF